MRSGGSLLDYCHIAEHDSSVFDCESTTNYPISIPTSYIIQLFARFVSSFATIQTYM